MPPGPASRPTHPSRLAVHHQSKSLDCDGINLDRKNAGFRAYSSATVARSRVAVGAVAPFFRIGALPSMVPARSSRINSTDAGIIFGNTPDADYANYIAGRLYPKNFCLLASAFVSCFGYER